MKPSEIVNNILQFQKRIKHELLHVNEFINLLLVLIYSSC